MAGDAYYSEYGSYAAAFASVQVLLGFFAMILLGVLALYIVYYICIVKTINRVKASAVNGVPDNRVPRFLTGFMMVPRCFGLGQRRDFPHCQPCGGDRFSGRCCFA